MNAVAEARLREVILPELEKGRPNWDRPHTEAVVSYMKELLMLSPELELDEEVLTIAAYAHDWGYAGLFGDGLAGYDAIQDQKTLHMQIGAKNISSLLKDPAFSYLTEKQKQRVEQLVAKHDMLKEVSDLEERILVEADTLAGLDIESVRPSFSKEDDERWREGAVVKRLSLFVTVFGKETADKLLRSRIDFYNQNP